MSVSVVTFSDCAWKLSSTRWRSTGSASARTSSNVTWVRPCSSARALAPSTSACAARTLAPYDTHSLMNAGAPGSPGRLMRTSLTA